jgi:voltage-dependent calcium channel
MLSVATGTSKLTEKTVVTSTSSGTIHSKQGSTLYLPNITTVPITPYGSTNLQQGPATTNSNEIIGLPFTLAITESRDKLQRNLPYLRHSWSRIDFIAILSFWVTFALATTGLERGQAHIGTFRALSTLRIARLLTITNGTTTIMHSLKTARPLLTSVLYFVVFAMVLFS